MDVQLLGLNHRSAPIELRETLALDGTEIGRAS